MQSLIAWNPVCIVTNLKNGYIFSFKHQTYTMKDQTKSFVKINTGSGTRRKLIIVGLSFIVLLAFVTLHSGVTIWQELQNVMGARPKEAPKPGEHGGSPDATALKSNAVLEEQPQPTNMSRASNGTVTPLIVHPKISSDINRINLKPLKGISCYNAESESDVLPAVDTIQFPNNSVFFHETSCKGGLNARQSCAVESAARSHPEWQINVLFLGPATQLGLESSSRLMEEYKNIKLYRVHLSKYSKGTPLEKLVASGALNRARSEWRISHASDVLRYLTLYKWGGVYLDLDVVVGKSFESLAKNWAARESVRSISAGAIAFSADRLGRQFAEAAARDIGANYRGDLWGYNGPGVITRVLQELCSTSNIVEMSAANCTGFEVYGPELFYPIPWPDNKVYFKPGHIDMKVPYVYHIWNHETQNTHVDLGSPYEELARKYCPFTFQNYERDFRQ